MHFISIIRPVYDTIKKHGVMTDVHVEHITCMQKEESAYNVILNTL